jgi:hypothetical protein
MLGLGLAISLALWLALALVVLLAIRGRSDAHRLLPIAIVVPALLTFPLGPTGLVLANAMLDASPDIEHVLEPLESHVGESDGDPYVWVRFRSFRDPTESLDLRFEGDHVPNAHARVHLFTHEGALGFPWIVHATLVD